MVQWLKSPPANAGNVGFIWSGKREDSTCHGAWCNKAPGAANAEAGCLEPLSCNY